jgi:hypothetical protein
MVDMFHLPEAYISDTIIAQAAAVHVHPFMLSDPNLRHLFSPLFIFEIMLVFAVYNDILQIVKNRNNSDEKMRYFII